MAYPAPHIVDPQPGCPHSRTVILLHGRSSTATEFAEDFFSLKTSNPSQSLRSIYPGFRWVFPNAGERWCTSFKENRWAWCDTFSLEDLSSRQDLQVEGLRDGVLLVRKIIEEEIDRLGGSSEKIILGGFSQGSATALWSLFTGAAVTRGRLGGFIGLSAWMPFTKEARVAANSEISHSSRVPNSNAENLSTTFSEILGIKPSAAVHRMHDCLHELPIFLGHDKYDIPVSIKNCHELSAIFRALGVDLVVREYVGSPRQGHWLKEPEQLDDIVEFIYSLPRDDKMC